MWRILLILFSSTVCLAQTTTRGADLADEIRIDPATETLINSSLKFLASKQLANGSFESDAHQVALTSYPLLAFMAAGNLPDEGPYSRTVNDGFNFLLSCVRADGQIAAPTGESNMYDHGIATVVLAELYGQTKAPAFRPKLERAIALITRTQNRDGGWRYRPAPLDADISVTVLQLVALRSAKNAGLNVPQQTLDRAVAYVKSCYDPPSGGFNYQPNLNNPGFARTAAAMYSLQLCGLYEDDMVKSAATYLQKNRGNEAEWFTYGHFYAAPAMYMIGQQTWKQWYPQIATDLKQRAKRVNDQTYWEGTPPVTNPVWATAVYTTILAVPYHYLPLYQR